MLRSRVYLVFIFALLSFWSVSDRISYKQQQKHYHARECGKAYQRPRVQAQRFPFFTHSKQSPYAVYHAAERQKHSGNNQNSCPRPIPVCPKAQIRRHGIRYAKQHKKQSDIMQRRTYIFSFLFIHNIIIPFFAVFRQKKARCAFFPFLFPKNGIFYV